MYFVTSSVEIPLTKTSHWLPFVKNEKAEFSTLNSSFYLFINNTMDLVRIKILFQLEGTYQDRLVQLHDHFRADQKVQHVKSTVQISLRHWQTWDRLRHLSKEPLPVLDPSPVKEKLPKAQPSPRACFMWTLSAPLYTCNSRKDHVLRQDHQPVSDTWKN